MIIKYSDYKKFDYYYHNEILDIISYYYLNTIINKSLIINFRYYIL